MKRHSCLCITRSGSLDYVIQLICIILLIIATSGYFLSCAKNDSESFYRSIQEIDSLVSNGLQSSAARKLKSLRKKASSASQWLSLVKRERSLGRFDQATDTLLMGLQSIPSSDTLAAVLVDTLCVSGHTEKSLAYTDSLTSSPFALVATYAVLSSASDRGSYEDVDSRYLLHAFDLTGRSVFLTHAITRYAVSGDYPNACSLVLSPRFERVTDFPAKSYFSAMLCYDAGLFDQTYAILSKREGSRTVDETLLMADSAVRSNNITSAQTLWLSLVDSGADTSPLPLYNLAASLDHEYDRALYLERCVQAFPLYYPALARFSRTSLSLGDTSAFDSIQHELDNKGLTSGRMEQLKVTGVYDTQRAGRLLDNALAEQGQKPDVRIYLEKSRLVMALDKDAIRTAADQWKLLEQYPLDPLAHDWAIWFFLDIGEEGTAFSLNNGRPGSPHPFYLAVEKASIGQLDQAISLFSEWSAEGETAWIALANIGVLEYKQKEKARAIETLSRAASMCPDLTQQSSIHTRIAEYLIDMRLEERAESVLGYALELDPSNYRARTLVRSLEARK